MPEMPIERLKLLIYKYLDERLTEAEDMEFRDYAALHPQVWYVVRRLQEDELLAGGASSDGSHTQKVLTEVRGPGRSRQTQWPPSQGKKGSAGHLLRTIGKVLLAAVIMVAAAGLGLLAARIIQASHSGSPRPGVARADTTIAHAWDEIHPGTYKATLILSNGKPVGLDSSTIGLKPTAEDEPVQVGIDVLSYIYKGRSAEAMNRDLKSTVEYHTLVTPRGGMFSVVLPDGSRVWLNNASTLKYPVHFNGRDRKVTVSGEANFTVVKDAVRPFVAIVDGKRIKVLGTRFTVTAYNPSVRTVLVEGRVEVEAGSHRQLLEAGEQLDITGKGAWKVKKAEDVGSADAWTRGLFYFRDMTLTEILQSLARWYDVDLDTSLLTTDPIRGAIKMSRHAELKDILRMLEDDKIHIRLKGNTIVASYR